MLDLRCGTRDLPCIMWNLLLWQVGSAVQACWLGHPIACRILFPQAGKHCVPCIGRWILNHWTTREVPVQFEKNNIKILTILSFWNLMSSISLVIPSFILYTRISPSFIVDQSSYRFINFINLFKESTFDFDFIFIYCIYIPFFFLFIFWLLLLYLLFYPFYLFEFNLIFL